MLLGLCLAQPARFWALRDSGWDLGRRLGMLHRNTHSSRYAAARQGREAQPIHPGQPDPDRPGRGGWVLLPHGFTCYGSCRSTLSTRRRHYHSMLASSDMSESQNNAWPDLGVTAEWRTIRQDSSGTAHVTVCPPDDAQRK